MSENCSCAANPQPQEGQGAGNDNAAPSTGSDNPDLSTVVGGGPIDTVQGVDSGVQVGRVPTSHGAGLTSGAAMATSCPGHFIAPPEDSITLSQFKGTQCEIHSQMLFLRI